MKQLTGTLKIGSLVFIIQLFYFSEIASICVDPERDNLHIAFESDATTELPSPNATPLRESDDDDDVDLPILIRIRMIRFFRKVKNF